MSERSNAFQETRIRVTNKTLQEMDGTERQNTRVSRNVVGERVCSTVFYLCPDKTPNCGVRYLPADESIDLKCERKLETNGEWSSCLVAESPQQAIEVAQVALDGFTKQYSTRFLNSNT